MAHRSRGAIPGRCPVLVTLRVLDDVPPLRRGRFVRAFRETPRACRNRPGFRVAHYSVQDDHAHFLIEAAGGAAAGERHEEPGGAIRALRERRRCRRLVFGRKGRVLAGRFHHVLKRTPTEVRRALAYVLLNARKHYRKRRRRIPPVVLDGASSGLWFDGWKGRGPPPGRYADAGRARGGDAADVAAVEGLAADRAGGSVRGAGGLTFADGAVLAAWSGNRRPRAAGTLRVPVRSDAAALVAPRGTRRCIGDWRPSRGPVS